MSDLPPAITPTSPALQWPSTRLSLAALNPEAVARRQTYIEGVVTLLKPYSTSSATFSLLVCEEDFRLRRSKGQLWLNLRGPAADKVHSKVQIGDKISLSMNGVQLQPLRDPSPGDVPWTVEVPGGVVLKVNNSSGDETIQIEVPAQPNGTTETTQEESLPSPATPPPRPSFTYSQTSETEWTTPDLFKRGADVLKSPPYLPGWLFDTEDPSDESRPRKKARMSSTFRFVSRTPSPEREIPVQSSVAESEDGQDMSSMPAAMERPPSFGRASRPVGLEMPPPPVPYNTIDTDNHEIPESPSLHPVESDTLPLVSPFLHTGLSSADYMNIDQESSSPTIQAPESAGTIPQDTAPEPNMTQTDPAEPPVLEPDGADSDKDSLFDSMSDGEGPVRRRRSKSPLPGPSPLRSFQRARSAGSARAQRPVLSALKTPSKISTVMDAPLKTPILYLPTPSPKVVSEGTQFPFSAPPKTDFVPKELEGLTKRKLFRRSAPTDLSSYFGRMNRKEVDFSEKAGKEAVSQLQTPGPGDTPGELLALEKPVRQRSPTPSFKSGVTTPLSDFPALAFLSWGITVDVIGVVSQSIPVAKSQSGAKDYYMAVRIADSSQSGGVIMRFFRPYKEALPEVRVGDVIMLRCFKIVSHKHKPMGVSTENSAWAVWTDFGRARPAVCAGPPMEYGEEEEEYVSAIGEWYQSLDQKKRKAVESKPLDDLASGVK